MNNDPQQPDNVALAPTDGAAPDATSEVTMSTILTCRWVIERDYATGRVDEMSDYLKGRMRTARRELVRLVGLQSLQGEPRADEAQGARVAFDDTGASILLDEDDKLITVSARAVDRLRLCVGTLNAAGIMPPAAFSHL